MTDVLNDAARTVLTGPNLAHLTTLNEDGSPQMSVVWVGLDGGQIVAAHMGLYKKLRNVQRDPRVALTLDAGGPTPPDGLKPYLAVDGTAEVVEGGALAVLRELARVYLGPDAQFPPPGESDDPEAGYVLRITPRRVYGVGPWKD